MAKPTKCEIENKAMCGLVRLAMADNHKHWMVLANELSELTPDTKIDEQQCLAEKIKTAAIKKAKDLAKPCKNQSPWMLETASDYLRSATLLDRQPNLSRVAMVNAAIAIEIILKSFTSEVVDNIRKGTAGEQYEINGKGLHSLTELAKKIDCETYEALGFNRFNEIFIKYDNVFMTARYPYEANSHIGFNSGFIQVGIEMFNETIRWYKRTGNTDQWVQDYPNVTGGALS